MTRMRTATAGPATRPPLGLAQLAAAPATSIRIMIDDLIDLILGRELATGATMPRLPTGLALLALPGQ
jgi:hypothetical protein